MTYSLSYTSSSQLPRRRGLFVVHIGLQTSLEPEFLQLLCNGSFQALPLTAGKYQKWFKEHLVSSTRGEWCWEVQWNFDFSFILKECLFDVDCLSQRLNWLLYQRQLFASLNCTDKICATSRSVCELTWSTPHSAFGTSFSQRNLSKNDYSFHHGACNLHWFKQLGPRTILMK